jgi:hypothetical protein
MGTFKSSTSWQAVLPAGRQGNLSVPLEMIKLIFSYLLKHYNVFEKSIDLFFRVVYFSNNLTSVAKKK